MPEHEDHLNPSPEQMPLAVQLQQLAPQMAPGLSRDALLFAAGQAAAAPRLAPWVWPSLTGLFAAVTLVLGAFLAFPGGPTIQYVERERVVYFERPSEGPAEIAQTPSKLSTGPQPTQEISHLADDQPSLAEQLKVRREVYRWGVEALPKSTLPQPRMSALANDDLARWLNVPPGIFSIHRQSPRKLAQPLEEEE